jgi:asparagine synthase (glutamine-hydrolysing)
MQRMLTVQPREAQSTDWLAQFDPQAFGRAGSSPSDRPSEPPLRIAGDGVDAPALGQASRQGRVLLFDGVLYDRSDLERTLGVAGTNASDASLVLTAFERWGEDFVHHLRGLFAVIAWDATAAKLIAARDPFGEYPLFFSTDDTRLLFSTSIDALLRHPNVRPTLNRPALADHLCQRWPDPTETFFANVRRVPPGNRLVWTAAGTTIARYWDLLPLNRPIDYMTASELEGFEDELDNAVERVLRRGPSGILLSGGLDSVSVATAATEVARRSPVEAPVAFSLAYPGSSNEEPLQRGVASALGLAQDVVPFWDAVRGGALLTQTLRLIQTLPVMLHSPWTPAYEHLMARASQQGLRTMMTGCGGDEAFTPVPLYVADLIKRGNLLGVARHFAAWHRSYNAPRHWYVNGMLWTYGLRTIGVSALQRVIPDILNRRRVRRSMEFSPSYVAPDPALRAALEQRVQAWIESAPSTGPYFLRELRRRLDHSLESQAREESFERSRRIGVHLSHPLRDPDLVRFVFRIPQRLIYGDGRAKYPLRRRVARRFPDLGFDQQKKLGGGSFFRSILEAEVPDLWRRTKLSALGELGIIDRRGAADMVNAAVKGDNARNLMPVWELLKLEAWTESRI